MDDWLVLAPTRWKLRKAVRTVRQVLDRLKIEIHPDKTFVGRADRGFDFLGYRLEPGRLMVSRPAFQKLAERISRLYEQGADDLRVGQYARRWIQWAGAGLGKTLDLLKHRIDDFSQSVRLPGTLIWVSAVSSSSCS